VSFVHFIHSCLPACLFFFQRESFWSWRTKLPPAIVQTGPHSIHFDISMPIAKLYQVVYDTRDWMNKQGIIGRDVVAV
jgi:(R)-2-hydroxyglutarate---pyruvate transhydrogenase